MKIIYDVAREVRNFEHERAERLNRLTAARASGDIDAIRRIKAEIAAEPNAIPRPNVSRFMVR